jgi:two-component system sensor histidine kinase BaeS
MFSAIGGVALLLAILVTIVLSRHLLSPVKELAEATRSLTSRRFDTRIVVQSRDEFGQLAADFNNMALKLKEPTAAMAGLFGILKWKINYIH